MSAAGGSSARPRSRCSSIRRCDAAISIVEGTLVQGEQPVAAPAAPASVPAKRAQLRVREDGAERAVPVDKELLTIGRLSECDIVINDTGASRRHAQIRTIDGVSTLTDLGSTNGTKVNGREVQSTALVGRRSHHGGSHPDRLSERVMLGAAVDPWALSAAEVRVAGAAVPVHLARDALGDAGPERRSHTRARPAGRSRAAPSPARPSMLLVQADGQKARSVRLDGSDHDRAWRRMRAAPG